MKFNVRGFFKKYRLRIGFKIKKATNILLILER